MKALLAVVAYLVVGAAVIAWFGWRERPAAIQARRAEAAATIDFPRRQPPAAHAAERTTWRAAHLDGWKWRLAAALDEVAPQPPMQPPGDPARSEGFAAGWADAEAAWTALVAAHGAQEAQATLKRQRRLRPALYDLAVVAMPPE